MTGEVAVVIRSRDEAPRLRLVLASLEGQPDLAEVVVVDDGSTDETPDVLAEAAARLPLRALRHPEARGRSAASNAGVRAARADVVLLLDGDTLLGPGAVAAHAACHRAEPRAVGRGRNLHLRHTRTLRDPESGEPRPEHAARHAALPAAERAAMRVSRDQVRGDFGAIAARAEPGIYPGAGPRRLQELEWALLTRDPDAPIAWATASGANLSVGRRAFLEAGGLREDLDNTEARELALRLVAAGGRMRPVEGAPAFHLTHRAGWRDPLVERGWEAVFHAAHPRPEVQLLAVFWAGLSARGGALPDLDALAAAAAEGPAAADRRRAAIGLPPLAGP